LPKLISFDIDGTLEVGQPPGSVTMDMVRKALELGYLVGSCSDLTISGQRRIWQENGIAAEFTVLKHQLAEVKAEFQAEEYFHIGDTDMDRRVSQEAGFRFIPVEEAVCQLREMQVDI
jgi:hydroxymethylpyrimidine pyrophosphatase-like HAD family hydrolase